MNDKTTEQIYLHLTLTSVVFELNSKCKAFINEIDLTLTSVVFEF